MSSRVLHMLIVSAFAATVMVTAPGCRADKSQSSENASDSIPVSDITLEAYEWADSVTHSLTLQKKVGQLFMPAVMTSADSYTIHIIADYAERLGVGGIIFLKGNMDSARTIADTLHAVSPIGMFVAIDAEKGLAMRLKDAPAFPWNSELNQATDELAMFDYGQELARECKIIGINMVLGPVLDVTDSISDVTPKDKFRSFGSDAVRASLLGIAYARGLEDGGVLSVAKHFPGHGSAQEDSHKNMAKVEKTRQRIMTHDIFPFRSYIDAGLSCIMAGHIYAAGLDNISRPATFSPVILTDLLRKKLGFKGLIVSDAINMSGAKGYKASDAILAGADIILAPNDTEDAMVEVRDAVEDGRIPLAMINDRCRRILFYKYLKGIASNNKATLTLPLSAIYDKTD